MLKLHTVSNVEVYIGSIDINVISHFRIVTLRSHQCKTYNLNSEWSQSSLMVSSLG